jgi:hypothetical protein
LRRDHQCAEAGCCASVDVGATLDEQPQLRRVAGNHHQCGRLARGGGRIRAQALVQQFAKFVDRSNTAVFSQGSTVVDRVAGRIGSTGTAAGGNACASAITAHAAGRRDELVVTVRVSALEVWRAQAGRIVQAGRHVPRPADGLRSRQERDTALPIDVARRHLARFAQREQRLAG